MMSAGPLRWQGYLGAKHVFCSFRSEGSGLFVCFSWRIWETGSKLEFNIQEMNWRKVHEGKQEITTEAERQTGPEDGRKAREARF